MAAEKTAVAAANERAHPKGLREHLTHGARLQRAAMEWLQRLDDQLMRLAQLRWDSMDFKDPRVLTLARHVVRLKREREQTARAVQIHQNAVALALQRARARQVEESGCTCSDPHRESQATRDPSCLSTAEWMRWRANQLHKRK